MAAAVAPSGSSPIRVRLHFDYPPPAVADCRMCWLLLDVNALRLVSDLESLVRDKFGWSRRSVISLFIDSCYLPHTESIHVVRDNDSIRVKVDFWAKVNGHTGVNPKKRQRADPGRERMETSSAERTKKPKKKKQKMEGTELTGQPASSTPTKPRKDSKMKGAAPQAKLQNPPTSHSSRDRNKNDRGPATKPKKATKTNPAAPKGASHAPPAETCSSSSSSSDALVSDAEDALSLQPGKDSVPAVPSQSAANPQPESGEGAGKRHPGHPTRQRDPRDEEPQSFCNGAESAAPDYSAMPLLAAPPQVGQTIAFKLLELSDNYTPEVSGYKEGKIVSYDPVSKQIELELLSAAQAPAEPGKFDLVYQNPDGSELVEYAVSRESRVTERWDSLLEPRLVL